MVIINPNIPIISVTKVGTTNKIPMAYNNARSIKLKFLKRYPIPPIDKAVTPIKLVITLLNISVVLPTNKRAGEKRNIKGMIKAPILKRIAKMAVFNQLEFAIAEPINTVPHTGGVNPAKIA